ncbi:MAG: hypothetical protein BroJett014_11340 [Planctomycetota bacterium]|nr:hypothetical protein [Planctomycetota bacterium]GIK52161.1 MAG: hypothetical protein BroJett014_11340 [Planctomycetota bacterium]
METYTIIEPGAVFSRAQTNPRRGALTKLREMLSSVVARLPSNDVLGTRMTAKAETLLAVFNDLLEQQHAFELVERGVEAQLGRADSRYNELPEGLPGRSLAIDKVRQGILTERQQLLHELRTARLQHTKELARLRERLLEAYNAFCSSVRLLPADVVVDLPPLDQILDFVPRTLVGGEITLLSTPELRPAREVRFP